MGELSVVVMQEADVQEVASLFDAYRQFYGQDTDLKAAEGFLRERLRRNESVVLVAKMGEDAVGFAQLFPMFSSVRISPIWVFNDLFVAESHRRMGAATALLEAAAQHGRDSGATRLDLATQHANLAAQSLYEKHGWARDTAFAHFSLPLVAN